MRGRKRFIKERYFRRKSITAYFNALPVAERRARYQVALRKNFDQVCWFHEMLDNPKPNTIWHKKLGYRIYFLGTPLVFKG